MRLCECLLSTHQCLQLTAGGPGLPSGQSCRHWNLKHRLKLDWQVLQLDHCMGFGKSCHESADSFDPKWERILNPCLYLIQFTTHPALCHTTCNGYPISKAMDESAARYRLAKDCGHSPFPAFLVWNKDQITEVIHEGCGSAPHEATTWKIHLLW